MTQIALVTGANKGIGFEIARGLLAHGMTVLIGARTPVLGEAAAQTLETPWIQLDVTDPTSIEVAAKRVAEEYGVLDVLVNNAGIGGSWASPSEATVDAMREVFDTNLFGVVAVTNSFLPLVRRSAAGRIVNVSSEVGSLAFATDPAHPISQLNALAYPASKTALNMVTVHYAKDLMGTAIKVNAVTPGYCATDLTGHAGHRTAAQGAEIAVKMALLPTDGPTGGFFDETGPVPW